MEKLINTKNHENSKISSQPKLYQCCKSHYQNDRETATIFVGFGTTGVTLHQSDKIQGKV